LADAASHTALPTRLEWTTTKINNRHYGTSEGGDWQTTQAPKGASAEGRKCRRAHVPNDARAEQRGCRTAQAPKGANGAEANGANTGCTVKG